MNNPFKQKSPLFNMASNLPIKRSFNAVKIDIEGVKDELAFAMKRISQLEATLNRFAIKEAVKPKPKKKKPVKKKVVKKTTKKKDPIWSEHLAKTRRRYPKLTLKECMEIASRTWKKKKKAKTSKKKNKLR